MTKTRDWDRERYSEADHELADIEIKSSYGDLIEEFLVDVATASDFHTLTKMARTADNITRRRALAAERQGIVTAIVECERAEFAVAEEHYFVLGCTPFLT